MPSNEIMDESLIAKAAEDLGRAICLSAQWRELELARAAFQADNELAELLQRYRNLSSQWREARKHGKTFSGADATALADVQEKIQHHPLSLRQQEAISAVVQLLQRVNGVLSEQLGFDFAANAAPRGGCCG